MIFLQLIDQKLYSLIQDYCQQFMEELIECQNQFGFSPSSNNIREYGEPWELISLNMKRAIQTDTPREVSIMNSKYTKNVLKPLPFQGKQNVKLGQHKNHLKILSVIPEQFKNLGIDKFRTDPFMCRKHDNYTQNDRMKADHLSRRRNQQNLNAIQVGHNQFLQSMFFKNKTKVQPITREQIINKRQAQMIKKVHQSPSKVILSLQMRRSLSLKHKSESCNSKRSVYHNVKKKGSNTNLYSKLPDPNKQLLLIQQRVSSIQTRYSDHAYLIITNSLGKGDRKKILELNTYKDRQMDKKQKAGIKHKLLLSPLRKPCRQKSIQ